jgi:hypothetical protein
VKTKDWRFEFVREIAWSERILSWRGVAVRMSIGSLSLGIREIGMRRFVLSFVSKMKMLLKKERKEYSIIK